MHCKHTEVYILSPTACLTQADILLKWLSTESQFFARRLYSWLTYPALCYKWVWVLTVAIVISLVWPLQVYHTECQSLYTTHWPWCSVLLSLSAAAETCLLRLCFFITSIPCNINVHCNAHCWMQIVQTRKFTFAHRILEIYICTWNSAFWYSRGIFTEGLNSLFSLNTLFTVDMYSTFLCSAFYMQCVCLALWLYCIAKLLVEQQERHLVWNVVLQGFSNL